MSTEGAILTMLENPDVFGVVNLGSIINILDRNARTVENVIPTLEKAGVIRRDGKVLHLLGSTPAPDGPEPLVASDAPHERHDSATTSPQERHNNAIGPPYERHNSATKSGDKPIDANNANLGNVDLRVKGEGVGFDLDFDLAVDVEVQNQNQDQDQHQVQDQTQKPACASEAEPQNPAPSSFPARKPIPKPKAKLEPKSTQPEKPERENTEHEAIFAALALACYGGTGNLTKAAAGQIAGAAKQLRSAGYSDADVSEIKTWISTNEAWRGLVNPSTIAQRAPAWANGLKAEPPPKPTRPAYTPKPDTSFDTQLARARRELNLDPAQPDQPRTVDVQPRATRVALPSQQPESPQSGGRR